MKKILWLFFTAYLYLNAGGMSDFANGVVKVRDGAGTYSTRDRTILYGGGYTMKIPSVSLTPFAVKSPSLKAGCGGIDMVFGSLGFLDKEQFVKFAKGIMAAAPGVAFDLALKTLCPSCSETLKALQNMANQINNMSLDSCQAATALGNMAVDGLSANISKDDMANNSSNNFFKAVNENYLKPANDSLQKANAWLGGVGSAVNKPKLITFFAQSNEKSLIEYSFGDHTYLKDGELKILLKSILGDLVIGPFASGDNPAMYKYQSPISSLDAYYATGNDKKNIIHNSEILINRVIGADDNTEGASAYNADYKVIDASTLITFGGIVNEFSAKTEAIANKIVARQSPTTDEIEFLGYFKFPVYKIFNTLGSNVYTSQILQTSSKKLGKMLATQLVYELLIQASQIIQERKAEADMYQDRLGKMAIEGKGELPRQLEVMSKESRYAAGLAYILYAKAYDEFLKDLSGNDSIRKAKELKQLVITRSQPDKINQLLYISSITPKVNK